MSKRDEDWISREGRRLAWENFFQTVAMAILGLFVMALAGTGIVLLARMAVGGCVAR